MFLFKPVWIAHNFKCSTSKQQQQQKNPQKKTKPKTHTKKSLKI